MKRRFILPTIYLPKIKSAQLEQLIMDRDVLNLRSGVSINKEILVVAKSLNTTIKADERIISLLVRMPNDSVKK